MLRHVEVVIAGIRLRSDGKTYLNKDDVLSYLQAFALDLDDLHDGGDPVRAAANVLAQWEVHEGEANGSTDATDDI